MKVSRKIDVCSWGRKGRCNGTHDGRVRCLNIRDYSNGLGWSHGARRAYSHINERRWGRLKNCSRAWILDNYIKGLDTIIWINAHCKSLDICTMISSGGLIDFNACPCCCCVYQTQERLSRAQWESNGMPTCRNLDCLEILNLNRLGIYSDLEGGNRG